MELMAVTQGFSLSSEVQFLVAERGEKGVAEAEQDDEQQQQEKKVLGVLGNDAWWLPQECRYRRATD